MTAKPIAGPAPVVWFLTARDGGASIRITPGLTMREDGAGRVRFDNKPDTQGWIRFDIEDSVPWVTVLSPLYTLAAGKRRLGDRLRLDESLTLALPNIEFQISRSIADRRRAHRTEVRVVRNDGDARPDVPVVRLLAPEPVEPPSDREAPEPDEAPQGIDMVAALPAYAPREIVPRRPATSGSAAQASRGSRQPYRKTRRRWHLWAWAAGAVAMLVAAELATPLRPLDAEAQPATAVASQTASADPVPSSSEPDGLLDSVESLLIEQAPPGPTTLRFAIEAYRAASVAQPGNRALRQRLTELQASLAETTR